MEGAIFGLLGAILAVVIGGLSALWYRLGRMEAVFKEHSRRIGEVEKPMGTLKMKCPLL